MQNQSTWRGFLPSRALVMGINGRARPLEAPTTQLDTLVLTEGNPSAELVFFAVSTAAQDTQEQHHDENARPFSGRSGELLAKMIEALGLNPLEVFLCHVITSIRSLERPLETLSTLSAHSPKVIVALGESAAHTLLRTQAPFSELRGRFHDSQGLKIMPTFHPEYLLNHPGSKRDAWSDLQAVAHELGLTIPPKKG